MSYAQPQYTNPGGSSSEDGGACSLSRRYSVLVIGCGAVGCLYGARLAEAGHDVTFLLRSDYSACKAQGLKIVSPQGEMYFPPESHCLRDTAEGMAPVDWLVLGLKAYGLRHARELAGPAYGPNTKVLAITNGLVDDELEQVFGADQGGSNVFGAIAYVAVVRPQPAVAHHLHYGQLLVGHLKDDAAALPAAEDLWRGNKIRVATTPCLLQSRWEKLVYNIPFSGMSLAMGGATIDKIAQDSAIRAEATHMMEEALAIGNADLKAHGAAVELAPSLIDKMWDLTDRAGAYRPSASVDLLAGRPVEFEHLLDMPLARAAALGVPAPTLTRQAALARAAIAARGATNGGAQAQEEEHM